ncbi:MAG: nucleotidyltransferase domain-containing protein [Thermoleophilia bacterium]
MLKKLLTNKSADKILRFLTLNRDASFYDKEISERTGLSRGVTNQILNRFEKTGIVQRERRGRMWFYFLTRSPLVDYYRIYDNLVTLNELVNELKPLAQRVILFGSTAKGGDTAESDIDLFIISTHKEQVLAKIRDFRTDRDIRPVVLTPVEYATSRSKDKAFHAQVENGLKLYGEEADEQRL